ncbi:hypothetical protein V8F20_011398 [Naviculisporaceae sp. PSN 640]
MDTPKNIDSQETISPLSRTQTNGLTAVIQAGWFPWVVLVSLGCVIACAAAAVGIVVASNNQTVESWAIQPAVLLAILSSIINLAVISALTPGLEVRFWLRAGRGTTLAQLHHIWNARGMGILGAIRAGSESRKVAIVSAVIYIIQFANGPLLQRSTFEVGRSSTSIIQLSLDIAPNIIPGTLNTRVGTNDPEQMDTHRPWIMIAQDLRKNTTITTKNESGYFCDGTCIGAVPGLGITHRCSPPATSYLDYNRSSSDGKPVFGVSARIQAHGEREGGGAYLALTSFYVSDISDSCMATITTERCNITAGLVEYPITVQNTTVTLRRSEILNMTVRQTYNMPGDSPTAPRGTGGGPLSALDKFVHTKIADEAISHARNPGRVYESPKQLTDLFFVANHSAYSEHVRKWCGLKWTSPTEYVLLSLHDFMFRAALQAAAFGELGVNYTSRNNSAQVPIGAMKQTFDVRHEGFELIFRSNERYLAAAIVSIGLAVILLVVLVWGWWKLESPIGFSPLGIAKAFGAPILRDNEDSTPNSTSRPPVVETILQQKGHEEFRLDSSAVGMSTGAHLERRHTATARMERLERKKTVSLVIEREV